MIDLIDIDVNNELLSLLFRREVHPSDFVFADTEEGVFLVGRKNTSIDGIRRNIFIFVYHGFIGLNFSEYGTHYHTIPDLIDESYLFYNVDRKTILEVLEVALEIGPQDIRIGYRELVDNLDMAIALTLKWEV